MPLKIMNVNMSAKGGSALGGKKILFACFCAALAAVALLPAKKILAAPPAGFQTNLIVGAGLDTPTGFGIAPDGRIFILQQAGNIFIYKNGSLVPQIFDQLPSFPDSDRGLLGIAFDPDFAVNQFVYFYYIDTNSMHRVVRFTATGDIATGGPVDIYKSGSIAGSNHAGGTIQFGNDGKLYLAIGDSGNPPNAQDLSNPMGKMLRMNKDGSIPSDNPFVGVPGARPEIWALGFRNPFRFQFDSVTGNLYLGDVGESTWEEINLVKKGGNYGWPLNEGNCVTNCANFIDPIFTYQHTTPGFSVTGGPVYHGAMFPPEYQGRLFFGDYAHGFLKTMSLGSAGNNTGVFDFDNSVGSIVDMKVAADGSLYYLTIFPGKLYRITYNTGNQSPIPVATANVISGNNPLTVNFSAASSTDPEGAKLTYAWDFGDGSTATSSTFTKVYSKRGIYTVQLTVSDGVNQSLANPITITVGIPPALTILSPTEGQLYKAGDTINYSASATDFNGTALGSGSFTREVILHHNIHIHPFLRPIVSQSGSFVIPVTGESSADTSYELVITATDSDGVSTSKSVHIFPKKVNLTFATQPANLQVTVDGIPYTAPQTILAVQGFQFTLDVPDQPGYEFQSWSNGGAKTHDITAPTVDTAFTAILRPKAPFVGQYFNNRDLSGTPALTRNDSSINFIWNDGSPDPIIQKDNFSARWTKLQNFDAGRYKFITSTDDGVRLFIDNKLIIDQFHDQPQISYSAVVDLNAGVHEIKMEYYDGFGGAIAILSWDLTTDPPTTVINSFPDFKGEYFTNRDLTGSPALTRNDPVINFSFNGGSPDPLIPVDNFSARWTKQQNFAAGKYTFVATSDDGVRLYIDNNLVIDKWIDQPKTSYSAVVDLTAGVHEIKMEYYEAFGGAIAELSWALTPAAPVATFPDYKGEYFTNRDLSGSPALVRNDAIINFTWNDGSPDPLIPVDNFSARWTKTLALSAGAYEFHVTSDDGARLFIDGEKIIDQFNDHPSTTFIARKTLTAGNHNMVMEYYEAFGGAVAKFSFAPVADILLPFNVDFFNNQDLSGAPVLSRQENFISNFWNNGSPDPMVNVDHFSARWQRTESFTAGAHTFTVTADDGVRLFIDGVLAIDQWHDQPATIYAVTKNLTAGLHQIKMEYYEAAGGAIAVLNEN